MKTRYFIAPLLVLAAGLTLGSCSVSRRVHTARSLTIEGNVTQLPTVAELEVAPQRAEADTAWVNRPFKGATSLKAQQQELVARILASAGADLLVEPKISHESRRRWFRTDHRLRVSGYPARYTGFRTASTEDIEKLQALRPDRQPLDIRPVQTLRPAQRRPFAALGKPFAAKHSVAVTDPVPSDEPRTRRFSRKTGYRGFLDAGYYLGLDEGNGGGFGISTTHGYQFADRFFVGVGAGFYYLNGESYIYSHGYSDYVEENYSLVPVYAALRAYVLKRRVSPYVDFRAGYEFCDAEGKYLSGGVGVGFGRLDLGGEYARIADLDSFRIRLGFSF